jgi:hypothetical protein
MLVWCWSVGGWGIGGVVEVGCEAGVEVIVGEQGVEAGPGLVVDEGERELLGRDE